MDADAILTAWRSRPPVTTNRRGQPVYRALKLLRQFDNEPAFRAFVSQLTPSEQHEIAAQVSDTLAQRHFQTR